MKYQVLQHYLLPCQDYHKKTTVSFSQYMKQALLRYKAVKNTLAKMLLRVKDSVIDERSEFREARSENAMKSRHDAGKMKEEKMKLKKIEMLNKKIMNKLKSEGECYFNLDINFTSDDLIEKIIYIVTCLKKCCKLSTNKSVLILNNLILDIIYKLYKSPFYYQIFLQGCQMKLPMRRRYFLRTYLSLKHPLSY